MVKVAIMLASPEQEQSSLLSTMNFIKSYCSFSQFCKNCLNYLKMLGDQDLMEDGEIWSSREDKVMFQVARNKIENIQGARRKQ